jgi:hypothetical protein
MNRSACGFFSRSSQTHFSQNSRDTNMKDIPILNDEISSPSELFWDIADAAILSKYPGLTPRVEGRDDGVTLNDDQLNRRRLRPAVSPAFQRSRSRVGGTWFVSKRTSEWRLIRHARGMFS